MPCRSLAGSLWTAATPIQHVAQGPRLSWFSLAAVNHWISLNYSEVRSWHSRIYSIHIYIYTYSHTNQPHKITEYRIVVGGSWHGTKSSQWWYVMYLYVQIWSFQPNICSMNDMDLSLWANICRIWMTHKKESRRKAGQTGGKLVAEMSKHESITWSNRSLEAILHRNRNCNLLKLPHSRNCKGKRPECIIAIYMLSTCARMDANTGSHTVAHPQGDAQNSDLFSCLN